MEYYNSLQLNQSKEDYSNGIKKPQKSPQKKQVKSIIITNKQTKMVMVQLTKFIDSLLYEDIIYFFSLMVIQIDSHLSLFLQYPSSLQDIISNWVLSDQILLDEHQSTIHSVNQQEEENNAAVLLKEPPKIQIHELTKQSY